MAVPTSHVTLEQWRALLAVVDVGGYAQAAQVLHKSQSSVTYLVQKLESQLGVKVFEIQGRKSVLTPTGQFLYRRARALLDEASSLEQAARRLSAGWEAEIGLAVEMIFPSWLLFSCLDRFGAESPHTHIEVYESVLGGTTERLVRRQADLAISAFVPPGFVGWPLMQMSFVLVANPEHPLHKLGRKVTMRDLRKHRHILVRESDARRSFRPDIDATRRWTVSHMATSVQAVREGYGYARFPEEKIRAELQAGTLKPVPLRDGGEPIAQLYLVFADYDAAGPGVRRLAEIIQEAVKTACPRQGKERGKGK